MISSSLDDELRFPKLNDEQMAWVIRLGAAILLEDGQEILTEGKEGYDFFVVESGLVQISKRAAGGASILRTHEAREFIGELNLLAGGPSPITARAVGAGKVIRLSSAALRDVLSRCPEMSAMVIPAMARRVHDVEGMLQERDRLASLGKLAAGLAHELNNPVAAGSRAVAGVRSHIGVLREHALRLGEGCFSREQIADIRNELSQATERSLEELEADPLALSDQETEVTDWLEERDFEDAWSLAPALVRGGFDIARLETLAGRYDADGAVRVVEFIAAQLSVERMLRDAEHSLVRISDIVRAVKGYSRMDQSPVAEIDVRSGIEDTLKMLAYPLRPYRIQRNYDPTLPTICAYVSELNQVWTNLIDNAVGAMRGEGTLSLSTSRVGEDRVRVSIGDTGSGIPVDVRPHIFEAFFTTKPAGEGTGLGLDIAKRIVTVRHNGEIDFETSPAGTTFHVTLPIRQPEGQVSG